MILNYRYGLLAYMLQFIIFGRVKIKIKTKFEIVDVFLLSLTNLTNLLR